MKSSMFKYICQIQFIVLLGMCSNTFANNIVNYELVVVNDAGNKSDTATGFGAVNYNYQIGKYEVTIGQYAAFLNSVAKADPYTLWNQTMMAPNIQGISRSGSSGNYVYTVANASTTAGSSESMPISGLSWFSAARFANWMANGQIVGAESAGTTEDGAYTLNGVVKGRAVARNEINPNTGAAPIFYIPTENEWYKAAYYNGHNGYYVFATQSNSLPSNIVGSGANGANYLADSGTGYAVSQSLLFVSTQTYITKVGEYSSSPSHYGTFDQTGNVWEWTDMDGKSGLMRNLRGAAWTSTPPYMQSSYRLVAMPSSYSVNLGFRLAGQ